MLETDEDALICDLAETYGLFDYQALQVKMLATLSNGLRDDSRIKMSLSGAMISTETMISAYCADNLALLVWLNTEDAKRNRNRPKSLVEALTKTDTGTNAAFDTVEEFEIAKKRILEGTGK